MFVRGRNECKNFLEHIAVKLSLNFPRQQVIPYSLGLSICPLLPLLNTLLFKTPNVKTASLTVGLWFSTLLI